MQAQRLEMVCQAPLHAAAAAGLAHVDRPSPTAKVERVEARPARGSRISQWMLRRGPESVDRPPGFVRPAGQRADQLQAGREEVRAAEVTMGRLKRVCTPRAIRPADFVEL